MVELIKQTKDSMLERMEQAINERGADRIDVSEMGKLADIVKDLAEAEKSCWEAEYYRTVTESMEDGSMGYDQMGYQGQRGGSQGGSRNGSQSRSGYRDSMGRYARRGYDGRYGHDDVMQTVKDLMTSADPQEREQLKRELRKMADM